MGEGLGAQGVVGRDWRLGRAARRALPRRRALAGAWPRDRAALRRPRAPGRGCILGPLAQPSQRLPEADSSQRSHTNTAPHHVGCPTRQTQRSSRHRPRTHKQHPSLSPPETRRTLTHTQNSTHSTYPAHQRSPHINHHSHLKHPCSRSSRSCTHPHSHTPPLHTQFPFPQLLRAEHLVSVRLRVPPAAQTSGSFSPLHQRKAACPASAAGGAAGLAAQH